MLTGSVNYDARSHLYTYSYTLDDRNSVPISNFYVRILTDAYSGGLAPVGSAAPAPYSFGTYTGQGLVGHPEFPGGTSFGWTTFGPGLANLATGVKTGFSFTTRYTPSTGGPDNYYLWSTAATESPGNMFDGVREVGWVVAPDYSRPPPPATPEPATLALAGAGLSGIILFRGRRARRPKR
jgi:hypothetical protein